jgi:GT2 family glycosyltransferase
VIEGFEHPDVSFVSGAVIEHGAPEGDYVPVTTQEVTEPHLISGTRVHVWSIGFGAMTAVRRSMIEQLGGWDERLGPGSERYPAGDDMDFNYRFLKAGGTAYVTPDARVLHDQWRTPGDLPGLYEGYAVAWSAFAIKHLRTGDLAGGARLWCWGVYDLYRMAGSAVRRHSRVRARIAFRKLIGIAKGTRRGLVERW